MTGRNADWEPGKTWKSDNTRIQAKQKFEADRNDAGLGELTSAQANEAYSRGAQQVEEANAGRKQAAAHAEMEAGS